MKTLFVNIPLELIVLIGQMAQELPKGHKLRIQAEEIVEACACELQFQELKAAYEKAQAIPDGETPDD